MRKIGIVAGVAGIAAAMLLTGGTANAQDCYNVPSCFRTIDGGSGRWFTVRFDAINGPNERVEYYVYGTSCGGSAWVTDGPSNVQCYIAGAQRAEIKSPSGSRHDYSIKI